MTTREGARIKNIQQSQLEESGFQAEPPNLSYSSYGNWRRQDLIGPWWRHFYDWRKGLICPSKGVAAAWILQSLLPAVASALLLLMFDNSMMRLLFAVTMAYAILSLVGILFLLYCSPQGTRQGRNERA